MRVLLTAQADSARNYLQKALTESLNSVEVADDLYYALHLASHEPFDALIVCQPADVPLRDLQRVLPELARLPDTPAIIVALNRASPADCASLLRAGADACFVQPWSVLEIHERMLALKRGVASAGPPGLDGVRLDPLTREAVDGERRIALTTREYLLIECLLRRANAPVARAQLTRYAWPEREDVEASSVNLVVSRLRRKLQAQGSRLQLETINRYGYQINTR